MKAVIVGTAGHIDHGKSALVRALRAPILTGWKKKNGAGSPSISGSPTSTWRPSRAKSCGCGFVDVPGHERFVRNMLAGIGGIDLVLLVIAADESVKPQTREHFDICRLLAVQRGSRC